MRGERLWDSLVRRLRGEEGEEVGMGVGVGSVRMGSDGAF